MKYVAKYSKEHYRKDYLEISSTKQPNQIFQGFQKSYNFPCQNYSKQRQEHEAKPKQAMMTRHLFLNVKKIVHGSSTM